MATHIALHEVGAAFEPRLLSFKAKEQQQSTYLALNPEGKVPALIIDGLCEATSMPLSTHCAPSLHAHVACAAKRVRHVEYFHDHVRVEQMFFDGALTPEGGSLRPDLSRPGFGLELRRQDARRYTTS